MSVMDDARILWEYHQMHHVPRDTDLAIGLGGHDIGVAEHTADLYRQGRFPLIVFTGANAPTTVEVFPRGEAVHYAERAEELGVPDTAIVLEEHARNTGENFTLARELLDREGIHPKSATIISRPYQQRRAYATCRKLWPALDVLCSSRPQTLIATDAAAMSHYALTVAPDAALEQGGAVDNIARTIRTRLLPYLPELQLGPD